MGNESSHATAAAEAPQALATVNKALSQWKELTAPQPVQRSGIPATGV